MIARMKTGIICAAIAAIALTAGCGSTAPKAARAVAKPSCDQQMTAWGTKARPAAAALDNAGAAVRRAASAEDFPAIRSGLERLGRAASRLETTPIPHCTDPAGHYLKWLDGLKAAGDNARSQSGLSGLQLAEEPLPKAKRQRQYLNAELKAAGYTSM